MVLVLQSSSKQNFIVFQQLKSMLQSLRAGYVIFAPGIIVGFANLVCGICVGIIGSSCALSDAQSSSLSEKILVIEIFCSAFGLFGVIVGVIMSSQATWPAKA